MGYLIVFTWLGLASITVLVGKITEQPILMTIGAIILFSLCLVNGVR